MTCFSTKRSCGLLVKKLGAIFLLTLALSSTASAQSSDELYRGTWQIDTPDDGALILVVKRNSLASYFWGDNADRSVQQGTWSSTESAATLTWGDGSQHKIERDALGFGVTFNDALGHEAYTTQAQQVPKEILGQWAKPPSKEDPITSDRDKAKGFFGTWEIGKGDALHYLLIESNRSAASTSSGTSNDSRGLRGAWARQGSELHIAWDSGHYSILRQSERGFTYKQIESGVIIEEDETEFSAASRTSDDNLPAEWLTNYQSEKAVNAGGIAFSSRKNARLFYRGSWLVKRGEKFERVELERFGGLKTSIDRSLDGNWLMTGQDIFMRWDDGMRKVLSPIGHGFVLYEYKPGRPLDGVPTRIFPAAPSDASKLAEHLKGREDVAQQMRALAEAAGIASTTANAGWGNTFMRWAWPFGEDEHAISPDALLEEGYGESDSQDPWWWPSWSEIPTAPEAEQSAAPGTEITTESNESETTTTEDAAINAATEQPPESGVEADTSIPDATETAATPTAESDKKPRRSSKKDWLWPF